MDKKCRECDRIVYPTADQAAVAAGGIKAVDRQEYWLNSQGEDEEPGMVQYSVLWDADGGRGGIYGGIRSACDGTGWERI
jgi:hypothetical protein